MGRKALVPIRIEVGLFECTSWYTQSPITFMSDQELLQGGINIDQSYHSQISDLKLVENEYQYYDRSRDTIKKIIKLHKKTGGNILLVAHAPSLEVLTRHLMNGQPRPERLAELASKVDFCSMTIVERESSAKPWHFRYSLDEKLSEDQQKLEQSRSASTLARSNSSSQLAPSPPPQQQQYTSMVQQPQTYATYTPKQPPSFYQPTPLNYHFHPQMENYPPYFDFA
ncbi:unnamed protein product [Didymodactylos carnosus]|nr:unnamed protein product [Didymodactylos carnosus]CAF3531988.1 unnamed protein product [Didymodactylos carnosus]